MKKKGPKSVMMFVRYVAAMALSLIVLLGTSAGVSIEEADAKRIFKAKNSGRVINFSSARKNRPLVI